MIYLMFGNAGVFMLLTMLGIATFLGLIKGLWDTR